jgi:hypothetical protein
MKIDGRSLQQVVNLLGAREEILRTLNHAPTGFDAHAVHQQRQRREDLGDAAAVERGANVNHIKADELRRLGSDTLGRFAAD